jgi:predicted AAA+ superfamily ATPase
LARPSRNIHIPFNRLIDRPEEIGGQGLEGLVLQHLQAWTDYSVTDEKVYYWKTRAGSEVDFIVYGSTHFLAIEVKNSFRIRPEDLSPLKSFITDYPECTPIRLYRSKERIMIDGILCIPVDQYLVQIIPGNPLPQ